MPHSLGTFLLEFFKVNECFHVKNVSQVIAKLSSMLELHIVGDWLDNPSGLSIEIAKCAELGSESIDFLEMA